MSLIIGSLLWDKLDNRQISKDTHQQIRAHDPKVQMSKPTGTQTIAYVVCGKLKSELKGKFKIQFTQVPSDRDALTLSVGLTLGNTYAYCTV